METTEKSFILSAGACDEIASLVTDFCSRAKVEKRDMLRHRLSVEECLLHWLSTGCEGRTVSLRMGSRFFVPYIAVEVEGEPSDPYTAEGNGALCESILTNLGLKPDYSYENGRNRISFRLKRKAPGQLPLMGILIASALLTGLLGTFLPEGLRAFLLSEIITPISDTFFRILGCVAGPMIFLSVAWGIYGIGDTATLGRIGKRMMIRFIGIVLIASCCGAVCFPILGPSFSGGGISKTQFGSILSLLLSVFPANIMEPFASGNSLQIIFLAFVVGIALLFLGERTDGVARAVGQINLLVQFTMNIVTRLVPGIIFLLMVSMIWSGTFSSVLACWKFMTVYVAVLFAAGLVFTLTTALKRKVNPLLLVKKLIPVFLIALTTASSAAAFGTNMDTCRNKLGIRPSLVSFGLPLGMMMHRPMCTLYYLLVVFFFAELYQTPTSPLWLVTAVLISAVMGIATPPIPGGSAVVFAVLFAQMGIPAEAMAVALSFDILTDFLTTAFEMAALPLCLVNIAAEVNMLDRDVLKSE